MPLLTSRDKMALSRTSLRRFAAVLAVTSWMAGHSMPVFALGVANTNLNTTSSASSSSSSTPVYVPQPDNEDGPSPPPPILKDLQEQASGSDLKPETLGLQIRADALREAALSYGARGGLSYRTFEIQRRLAEYDNNLSRTFDFSRLLIAAPSGLLIEPPVVSEAQKAVLVKSGGQAAAVADRIYRINRVARIVTAPRNWRLYLERDWGRVDPPPGILLPKTDDERDHWREWIHEGWNAGLQQAQETFEADLDRMTNDFTGMVRYRELLAQRMISPPYTLADDRGVTGGGSEMRVGDRGVTITGQSMLIPQSRQWTPANR